MANICKIIIYIKVRGAYNILVRRPEGRRPLGRPRIGTGGGIL
jgi:hypothetical protein